MLQETIQEFLKAGKVKEAEFAKLFNNVTASSKEQDMKEHWDLQVGFKVDVKGLKKVRRSDSEVNENIHWLEIRNVNGANGWLYSEETDLFAFETHNYWIVVEKAALQALVKERVQKVLVESPELYKLYRRKGRKDLMTLVSSMDLCYICATMLKKDGVSS
jgi:hypothetical protein